MRIELVTFDLIFLQESSKWLSDPEIKMLVNAPSITQESQNEWYNSLKSRKDYLIWGVRANLTPIGVCGIKSIRKSDCEYWGYIGERTYWGKGIGSKMLRLVEERANTLRKESIWLKVLRSNIRAINLYKKCGYIFEKEDEDFFNMRKYL